MHHLNRKRLSRRTFLKAGAVTIGLPLLDAMLPVGVGAEKRADALQPRHLALLTRNLGCIEPYFFPKKAGLEYEATRYLKLIDRHRGRFTVFSGLSHLGYPNSHHTEAGLLTGVPAERIQRHDDIRNTVSLDQVVAEQLGLQTRIPYLVLGEGNYTKSYNRRGVMLPAIRYPSDLFTRLFVDGKPDEVKRELARLRDGRSILDDVREQMKDMARDLGAEDRNRIDVLGTSIREAEQLLRQEESWAGKPKPKVDRKAQDYQNPGWSSMQKMWHDLLCLAFQTDSTRVVVLTETEGSGLGGYAQHDASHHGQDPKKIEGLALYEEEETKNVGEFLDKLVGVREGAGTLLDRTIVLWASNIGDASPHASYNLPILVAGGGFKHRGHVAFDTQRNAPLSNLYLRFLHQMGIEMPAFGSSTGVLDAIG